ncbi:hypothetical protein PV326_012183 [Microctonus aethiopoides]|nr:hypothetical protein PV326_012183 [Microctonus aethiopoides]
MNFEKLKITEQSPPGPSMDQEKKSTEPGAEEPKVRYSGAARMRYKKKPKRLGAEQAQSASAPALESGASDSRVQGANALHPSTLCLVFSTGGPIRDRSLMDKQDPGLNSKAWILVKSSEKKEATSSHFAALVNDRAIQAVM